MNKEEIVRDLAIKKVCPISMYPKTVYEHNMVKSLTQFGLAVLDAVEHGVERNGERTGATCEHGIPMSRACALCGDQQY